MSLDRLRAKLRNSRDDLDGLPCRPLAEDDATAAGPVRLKAKQSPIGGFIFTLVFALIWNGAVWAFLVPEAARGWKNGFSIGAVGFTLFASLFVLAGAAVAVAAVYTFLSLFNPRMSVTISRAELPLGEQAEIAWEFSSGSRRMTSVTVSLEGVEEARYRRGTNHYTDRYVFAKRVLFETSDTLQMQRGKATVAIPADTMHSFESSNNKVIWRVAVRGVIARWPDVSQEFDLVVLPAAGGGAAA